MLLLDSSADVLKSCIPTTDSQGNLVISKACLSSLLSLVNNIVSECVIPDDHMTLEERIHRLENIFFQKISQRTSGGIFFLWEVHSLPFIVISSVIEAPREGVFF